MKRNAVVAVLGLALAAGLSSSGRAQTPEAALGAKFAEAAAQARTAARALKEPPRPALDAPTDAELRAWAEAFLSDADPGKLAALFKKTKDAQLQKRIVYHLLVAAPDAGAPSAEAGIRSMVELVRDTPKLSEYVKTYILKTLAERAAPSSPCFQAYFDTLYQVGLLD